MSDWGEDDWDEDDDWGEDSPIRRHEVRIPRRTERVSRSQSIFVDNWGREQPSTSGIDGLEASSSRRLQQGQAISSDGRQTQITSTVTNLSTVKPKLEETLDQTTPQSPESSTKPILMDLRQILQCTICLDFAASPIHTCANAHVICGVCAKKLNNCPTCKLKTLTINSLADKIAKEANVMILCLNSDFGCNEIVSSSKLAEHLRSCYWREIPCYEIHGKKCNGKELLQINNFLPHLQRAHNFQTIEGPTHNIELSYPGDSIKYFQWATYIIKFDQQIFFNFSEIVDGNFHLWIATLGNEENADRYQCVVKFIPPADGPNYNLKSRNEVTNTLRVFPIHDCPRVVKNRPIRLFPIMTLGMLKDWTRKTVVNYSENWYFKILINIKQKEKDAHA